jgi:hypothetical protein
MPKNDCSHPKGFSMIAHCKAMGKIPRTGKKNKGKYIKSPKYSRTQKSRKSKRSHRKSRR